MTAASARACGCGGRCTRSDGDAIASNDDDHPRTCERRRRGAQVRTVRFAAADDVRFQTGAARSSRLASPRTFHFQYSDSQRVRRQAR